MLKFEVQIALEAVAEARSKWLTAMAKFNADVEYVMTRLLNEAAANYMSVDEVAKASGFTPRRVRMLMRQRGLDPKAGKRLLAKHAANTLAENAALLGVEPHEMDLMSPLAYLPMGSGLKKFLETEANQGIKELPEDEFERLADLIYDEMPWEGETYQAVAEKIATAVLAERGDVAGDDL